MLGRTCSYLRYRPVDAALSGNAAGSITISVDKVGTCYRSAVQLNWTKNWQLYGYFLLWPETTLNIPNSALLQSQNLLFGGLVTLGSSCRLWWSMQWCWKTCTNRVLLFRKRDNSSRGDGTWFLWGSLHTWLKQSVSTHSFLPREERKSIEIGFFAPNHAVFCCKRWTSFKHEIVM